MAPKLQSFDSYENGEVGKEEFSVFLQMLQLGQRTVEDLDQFFEF